MAEKPTSGADTGKASPSSAEPRPSPWTSWTLVTTLAVPLVALAIGAALIVTLKDGSGGGGGDAYVASEPDEICRFYLAQAKALEKRDGEALGPDRWAYQLESAADDPGFSDAPDLAVALRRQAAALRSGNRQRALRMASKAADIARHRGLQPCARLARAPL
jgi:hypothetical protein